MTFIVRMLRYLFWVVVVAWTVSLLRRLVSQTGSGEVRSNREMDVPSGAVNQRLVRDPVCGMHLAEGLALSVKQGAETQYFCSPECRDKYMRRAKKYAANA